MPDYTRNSWIEVPPTSDFPIQNLPFGVFQTAQGQHRLCSAIGNYLIDLFALVEQGWFDDLGIAPSIFQQPYLNDFIALGKSKTQAFRKRLMTLLDEKKATSDIREKTATFLLDRTRAKLVLPLKIGDYTDFYSSREHATNVGAMFRDPKNALLPNWLHLPVGYHGRASSIVVSGTPIRRPQGQFLPKGSQQPQFGASRMLDFELEMAFVVGKSTHLGEQIPIAEAEDHIFGLVLFNDWSARDIQSWEYRPLGPFLGKSFASTISPWVVTLEALTPFRVAAPPQEPTVLPYLRQAGNHAFDIQLAVDLQADGQEAVTICHSNFKNLYWTMTQQLTHHTSNGCPMNVGDLCASGTISGATPDSYGSLLELSWRGEKPLTLRGKTQRTFLEDGDVVRLRGFCQHEQYRIGFGEAEGTILPATSLS